MQHLIVLGFSLNMKKIWLHQLKENTTLIFCMLWKRSYLCLHPVGMIYSLLKSIEIIILFQWRTGSGLIVGTLEEQ